MNHNCKKKIFWLENIFSLDESIEQLASKMNFLSILVVLLCCILYYLNYNHVFLILTLLLIIIIIIYYIQKEMIQKENYAQFIDLEKMYDNKPPYNRIINPANDNSRRFEPTRDVETLYTDNNKSTNQRLVGPPNPKTLEAPVIVPKSHDIQHWKTNNLVVPSCINKTSNYDNYRSGYSIQVQNKNNSMEQYKSSLSSEYDNSYINNNNNTLKYGNNLNSREESRYINFPEGRSSSEGFCVNNRYPHNKIGGRGMTPEEEKNIYMQTIQPGIYSTIDTNEPISSNIGISYQPQFKPVLKSTTGNAVTYTETHRFGELINPNFIDAPRVQAPNIYNTFDPRFNGYGSDNRSYIDKMTGQQRFFYDDINAIKMPNYISRSNIDFINAADSYGPVKEGYEYGNPNTGDIREIAELNYLNSTLQFRSDLQESLMRKRNNEMHQLRIAPLNRNQQRSNGGMGRF